LLRAAIAVGDPLLGTFVKSADPLITEILAGAGFDCLVADLEHSSLTVRDLETIVRAADVSRTPVIARLPAERLPDAGRAIEAGIAAIQVSNVSTPEDLHAARAAVTLAPGGHLGLSLSHRAAAFGAPAAGDYVERLTGGLPFIAQIESRTGIAALPDLLALPDGPDAWFLGPMDLSADLGHPGRPAHPEVRAALHAAAGTIVAAGRALGVFAADDEDARDWRDRGARLVILGSDLAMIAGQARAVTERWRAGSPPR
jgi:4-hydroxy-2-oxoheptanedioate aldolase